MQGYFWTMSLDICTLSFDGVPGVIKDGNTHIPNKFIL